MTRKPVRPGQEWRVLPLIKWGTRYFSDHSIPNARMEVEWLLAHQLGLERVDLYVQFDRVLTSAELAGFKGLVRRRVRGEPFQYILGKAPFYGRDFKVTPAVLIPRPESEVLVQQLRQGPDPASIVDLGTGSGCLAVTAALLYPQAKVLAVDDSPEALAMAAENARLLGATNVSFQELDILQSAPAGRFDAVMCNPPYVPAQELPRLQREIREHEPRAALTDELDGLTYFRRLAEIGPDMLTVGGRLLVEIGGAPQAEPVVELFTTAGAGCQVTPDLQGEPRVVEVRWGD